MPRNIGDLPATLSKEDSDPRRPFVTNEDHYTVDCICTGLPESEALEEEMKRIPGVIETGLFIGLAHVAMVGGADGIEILMG
jgi:ribose 5-phosphate isomerase A